MKSLIHAVAVAVALTVPAISFAQSNGPITREQVRAELVQLEKAGWRPAAGSDPHYPEDLQAAQARVREMNANSGYGGVENASAAGRPAAAVSKADWNAMYSHP